VSHLFFLLLLLLGFGSYYYSCFYLWWEERWCYNIGLMHGSKPIDDGRHEPLRLGPIVSSRNNGSCFVKSLLATMWHNFVVFQQPLVHLLVGNFVVQELLLFLFFFFPLPNMSFQGFNNVTTSCRWALIIFLTSPTSFLTFSGPLPWQFMLVFSLLLPITHGSLSKLNVFQTSW